ncbi:hypothetical protein CBM2623_A80211 [Cupriavidus taiwanensis]|nr:hypothetical protein CBM2623_A80211 [Cupriavidus taiwanensis]
MLLAGNCGKCGDRCAENPARARRVGHRGSRAGAAANRRRAGIGRRWNGARTRPDRAFSLFPFAGQVLRISGIVRDSPPTGKDFFGTVVLFLICCLLLLVRSEGLPHKR